MARPVAPEARKTSTSTVGLPRESRTSRPATCSMEDMVVGVAPVAGGADGTAGASTREGMMWSAAPIGNFGAKRTATVVVRWRDVGSGPCRSGW